MGGILNKRVTKLDKDVGMKSRYYAFFRILTVTPSSCVYVHVRVYYIHVNYIW